MTPIKGIYTDKDLIIYRATLSKKSVPISLIRVIRVQKINHANNK
jgi:hypothetical protein